jgi:hypothetical protein
MSGAKHQLLSCKMLNVDVVLGASHGGTRGTPLRSMAFLLKFPCQNFGGSKLNGVFIISQRIG